LTTTFIRMGGRTECVFFSRSFDLFLFSRVRVSLREGTTGHFVGVCLRVGHDWPGLCWRSSFSECGSPLRGGTVLEHNPLLSERGGG
jgi:hypothetical protein